MLREEKKNDTSAYRPTSRLTEGRSITSEIIIKVDTAAGADGLDELPVVPKRVSKEVLSIG